MQHDIFKTKCKLQARLLFFASRNAVEDGKVPFSLQESSGAIRSETNARNSSHGASRSDMHILAPISELEIQRRDGGPLALFRFVSINN